MAKLFGTTQTEWDSSIHYLELALVEYNKVTDGNHKYYMEFLSETHSKLATYLLHCKKDTTSARIHIEKSLAYLLNKPFYTLNQPIGVEYDLREMMSRGKAIGQTLADLYKQNPQKIFLQRSQELIDLSLHLIQNTITKNPRHSGKWSDELAWGIEIEAYVRFIDEQFPLTSQKAEEFISLMESAQDISYKKSRSEMSFKNSEMNVLHRQLRTLEVRQQALERERANLPEDHYRNKNIQLLSSIDSLQNNISPIDIGDPNSEISSARDIQQVLGPGDVYFSYMANTGNSFNCAVITADTMLVHQISRDVWPDLIGFGISTQNQKNISREWCLQSNRIYKLLFEPFIPHGENLNITIVRDQETQNIPFDALVVEMPEQIRGNENDIVYLAHLHSVNYEFSGTSFCASRQQKDQIIKSQLLAFAPIYNSNKAETSEEKVIVPDLRSACYSLIHNEEEVKEIAIDQNDIAIFGMEANEERFLQEIKKSPNIIHLAMHAFSNISDPLLSGLVFSNIDQTDYMKSSNRMNETPEDGILHAFEIYQMNITSKLIVLSACETGHGEFFRGEGTRSLGQAFRYAGCDNIIMSLWKVNDGSTKEIMVNFYNELRNGIGKSEALSKAKRKFLKEHPKTGPFYWAPFTLLGDNEPIFQKNNPPAFWWLAGLGLIISTFFFFKRVYKPIQ